MMAGAPKERPRKGRLCQLASPFDTAALTVVARAVNLTFTEIGELTESSPLTPGSCGCPCGVAGLSGEPRQ